MKRISPYMHAMNAAKWCRERPASDPLGRTNFQRLLAEVNAMTMDKGCVSFTTNDVRALVPHPHPYTSAVMRWLMMADWGLCGYIKTLCVPDFDGEKANPDDKDRKAFAELFRGFGVNPISRDHIQARKKWERHREEIEGQKTEGRAA